MGWDASRPVQWQRMIRDWLIYVSIMFVVIVVFFRGDSMVGIVAGLLVSGPLYLAFGYVLAKFGYQRKTLRELRAERAADPTPDTVTATEVAGPRPKPAPTRRTGGGSRPGGSRKRR